MLSEKLFHELIGEDEFELRSGDDLLQSIREQYDIEHVSYLGINIPKVTDDGLYVVGTYSPEWVKRYVAQDYVSLDPVVDKGMKGMLPLDWRDVRNTNKKVRDFFAESREFGLGQQGLSIPIRGVHGEQALFSVNVDLSDDDWTDFRRERMSQLVTLAYHFHLRVLDEEGIKFEQVKLTPREREIVKWAAGGKNYEDIADILGIARCTVDYHMTNLRGKFGATNTAHLVAQAIKNNLI